MIGKHAAPRGPRRLRWVVAAAAAVVAVAGAVVLVGGDDEGDTASEPPAEAPGDGSAPGSGDGTTAPGPVTDSPVATTEALLAAVEQGDCATMINLMTVESWGIGGGTVESALAQCQAEYSQDGGGELAGVNFGTVTLVSETADEAVVEVSFELAGQTSSEQWPVRRVDGAWKVHLEPSSAG
ncbi:MAG TPA: hypothetical protein VFI47_02220 [Acidimicrobiales bacterium]|nr:hypothetical protein [Acidimicrobiales bacterium]